MNINQSPIEVQTQLLTIETGSAVLAFANLELRLMVFFDLLLGISSAKVSLAVWEGMIFREKVSTTNRLVLLRVNSPSILAVWNGIKRAPPVQSTKGVYERLKRAGDLRNKLVHSIPNVRFDEGKPPVVVLQPSLSNDSNFVSINGITEMRCLFEEVASELTWLTQTEHFYLKDGVRHPIPEPNKPDLVQAILRETQLGK
jgi:hypothetical protein